MRDASRLHAGARRLPGSRSGGAAHVVAVLVGLLALAVPAGSSAQTYMTQEEALELAFPGPVHVERKTAYLSDGQLAEARARAGDDVEIEQAVVTYYVGSRAGRPVGVAYFDVHRVRTKAEVVMIVVAPDARIERIDVVKFTEPPEYAAPEGWIDQLEGRPLDHELALKGAVRNLTGATLTARALTRAARRVLALHAVIGPVSP